MCTAQHSACMRAAVAFRSITIRQRLQKYASPTPQTAAVAAAAAAAAGAQAGANPSGRSHSADPHQCCCSHLVMGMFCGAKLLLIACLHLLQRGAVGRPQLLRFGCSHLTALLMANVTEVRRSARLRWRAGLLLHQAGACTCICSTAHVLQLLAQSSTF